MANDKLHTKVHRINGGVKKEVSVKSDASDITIANKEALPQGCNTVEDLVGVLGDLAFEDNIDIPKASINTIGVVQLSNETTDKTKDTTAATTAAVSAVQEEVSNVKETVTNDTVDKTSAQDISGVKNFSNGMTVGGILQVTASVSSDGKKWDVIDII